MIEDPSVRDFTQQVERTDRRPEAEKLRIEVLGIFGELGSLMSEIKKGVREGPAYTSFRDTLVEEAGDLLWYFLLLFAVIVATELRKVGVPGAPVPLLVITVAAAVALAIAHLPLMFTRFPRKGRIAAYASIIAMLVLFGVYHSQMEPVWSKTPEGAKEADRAPPLAFIRLRQIRSRRFNRIGQLGEDRRCDHRTGTEAPA